MSRELDRELHPIVAPGFRRHVLLILLAGEYLLQKRPELNLPPRPARPDVCENLLEIPHTGRERPHLTQAELDLFQPLADVPERLAKPLLQGILELLVDGLAHLFELSAVIRLYGSEFSLHAVTHPVELLPRRLLDRVQLGGERIELAPL